MATKTTTHRVFCDNVTTRRAALGLTQVQVAAKLGMAQPSYAVIETGKCQPTLNTVVKVATALRTTPAELLTPKAFAESKKNSRSAIAAK